MIGPDGDATPPGPLSLFIRAQHAVGLRLGSRKRFLRSGELVLLGRIQDTAMARSNEGADKRIH